MLLTILFSKKGKSAIYIFEIRIENLIIDFNGVIHIQSNYKVFY